MDGVVHPNVEQAIGRDRIRKALKRYENRPADEHRYGIVRSVNEDGSYEVLLDGDVQTSRCAQYGTALVGDRVLAVTKKDGRNDLIGRLGGEIGGGGTVVTKVDDVSNYVAGRVFAHAGTNDPAGALLCDGRAVSRREYWELFDAIGTTYGAGDGSSTFNLPNIESRTIIGESDNYALGTTGGEEKHTLSKDEAARMELPYTNSTASGSNYGAVSGSVVYTGPSTISGFVEMARRNTQQPFNVMQPYIVMRYFITTGKGDPASGINPADYVVEWGSWEGGGTCRYEKYASGRCKIWGTICNEFFTTASGSRSFTVKLPFTLLQVESAVAASWSPKDVSYFGSVDASIRDLAEANASSFKLQLAWTETNANMLCGFEVSGTWKDAPASGGVETIAPTIAERFEKLETDYIVAEGTSGIWTWRKWASGEAECWGKQTFNPTGAAWLNHYIADTIVTLPFGFTTFENALVSVTAEGSNVVYGNIAVISGTTLRYYHASMNDVLHGTSNIYIKGRWK